MKKIFLLIIILTLLLHGCSYLDNKPPYGVWESADPDIVMYVDPEIGNPESGLGQIYRIVYTPKDGTPEELTVFFHKDEYKLNIGKEYKTENEVNGIITEGIGVHSYFIGTYKKTKDKLTVSLISQRMAGTDYEEIVFTKIQDYDEVTE